MTISEQTHEYWMQYALSLADKAEKQNEIPVGAVVVLNGEIVGEGWNQSITLNDPTAHAEVMALRDAGKKLDNYRLVDAILYVTLEPCPMCCGAIVHSRIDKLIFGAKDLKTGSAGSIMNLVNHPALNHQTEITSGILAKECSEKISSFFKKRRKEKKLAKQHAAKTSN